MNLEKPAYIAENPIMSEKWDEITKEREFEPVHATTIEQLCFWYAVLRTCQEDISSDGDIRVAYVNDIGDVKAFPQMGTAKQASDQIQRLNKMLGINDQVKEEPKQNKVVALHVLQQTRESKAASRRRTAKTG